MRSILVICLLFTVNTLANVDFSRFELTTTQLNLLEKMQKKDKYTDEKLVSIAQAFERHNESEANRRDEYIPPHNTQLLMEIQHWARGASFSSFAKYTNLEFDNQKYRDDCPDWAVFNFGRATAVQYLKVDLLSGVFNANHELQHYLIKFPDNFTEKYLDAAKRDGFDIYLK